MKGIELERTLEKLFADNLIDGPKVCAREIIKKHCNSLFSEISPDTHSIIMQNADRRIAGEPLQYIIGEWEFYGNTFKVGPGVLIPRQDTETLVETALKISAGISKVKVADLCAGSGCVGISFKKERSDAEVICVEKSKEAIAYLNQNVSINQTNITVKEGDIFTDIPDNVNYDLIISNPPYIRTEVLAELPDDVKKEPAIALDGGSDGLRFYKVILEKWKYCLKPGGKIAVEIGFDQADEVESLFYKNCFYNINVVKDLCGNQRVIFGTYG